jgi:hypothetical protein
MKKLFIAMTLVTAAASASAAATSKTDAKVNTTPTSTTATSFTTTTSALSPAIFKTAFPGNSFTALATTGSGSTSLGGALLSWTYSAPTAKNSTAGSFTITSNKAITVDLGFGVNTNGKSGEWFFDNIKLAVGTTTGSFNNIDWVKWTNGNTIQGGLSGAMYARDVTVSPVPEPESYAMMLGALGMLTFVARRKRS